MEIEIGLTLEINHTAKKKRIGWMVLKNIEICVELTDLTVINIGQKKKPSSLNVRNYDSSYSKLEELYKTLPSMMPEEVVVIRLMFSEPTDEVLDSTCLMRARVKYAMNQITRNLTKDIHGNISDASSKDDVNPVNEPESLDTGLTGNSVDFETCLVQDSGENIEFTEEVINNTPSLIDVQDLPYNIVEVDVQDLPTSLINKLELPEISLIKEYIMEETESQGMDRCEIIELPEEHIASESVEMPDLTVKFAQEQGIEGYITEEVVNDINLPEICTTEVNKSKLERPRVNLVKICEIPREIKLEMPINVSQPKIE